MKRPIFHLAFPVRDLDAARAFYVDLLDARVGRDTGAWIDILFLGHQLTLHQRPEQVLPEAQRGVRHFGAILDWDDWLAMGRRLKEKGVEFTSPPSVSKAGTEHEQGKMLFADPSGNLIEIKAYRNPAAVLGVGVDEACPGVAA